MDSTPQYGEVIRTERLSPSLQRVILGGVGLEHFEPSAASDSYVNVLFPPPDATYTVPFDIDAARELPPSSGRVAAATPFVVLMSRPARSRSILSSTEMSASLVLG